MVIALRPTEVRVLVAHGVVSLLVERDRRAASRRQAPILVHGHRKDFHRYIGKARCSQANAIPDIGVIGDGRPVAGQQQNLSIPRCFKADNSASNSAGVNLWRAILRPAEKPQ